MYESPAAGTAKGCWMCTKIDFSTVGEERLTAVEGFMGTGGLDDTSRAGRVEGGCCNAVAKCVGEKLFG